MLNGKKDVIERFLKLYVAAVSDAVDRIGIKNATMDTGIRPVTNCERMAGFTRPVKLVPLPENVPYADEQMGMIMKSSSEANPYDVIVIDMSASDYCAGWGQILTRIAKSRGAVGAVIDGMVRDIAEVNKMDFPVFARGRHPGTTRARMIVESIGEPITCGRVNIHSGDVIFADGDGVIVIPENQVEDVLKSTEEVVHTDTWWDEELKKGADPQDLQKKKPIP